MVGTTGLSHGDIDEVASLCREYETPAVIAPNFSIGANLMMKFAAEAAALMDYAAIIESHHEGKLDAPSGTALATAERMVQARGEDFESRPTEHFALEGVRGGIVNGISIHSIRMAGVVANQSVVFGGPGETLSIERVRCFIPGVLLAIREVRELEGLVYGLGGIISTRGAAVPRCWSVLHLWPDTGANVGYQFGVVGVGWWDRIIRVLGAQLSVDRCGHCERTVLADEEFWCAGCGTLMALTWSSSPGVSARGRCAVGARRHRGQPG